MKATIILAHPWHGSFNKAIMDTVILSFRKNNKEYQIIDLNKKAPAHILYCGSRSKIYMNANSSNWDNLQTKKVFIISALFGIIRADNCIPYYNLAINDVLDGELTPLAFWKGKLDGIIRKLTSESVLIDLLSNNYRSCITQSITCLTNPETLWEDKYGAHRGRWLKENL